MALPPTSTEEYPADFGSTPSPGVPAAGPRPGQQGQTDQADFGSTPSPKTLPPVSPQQRLLTNVGEDDPYGTFKNAATALLLKMPTHVPGMFGDARELGELAMSNLASIFPGEKKTAKQIREETTAGHKFTADRLASIHGPGTMGTVGPVAGTALKAFTNAPSGADIYSKYVDPILGEYDAKTWPGRVGSAFLESAMPLPGGKIGAVTKAVTKAAAPVSKVGRVLTTARNVGTSQPVVGGVMGGVAEGVTEATGSPGAGIAASMAVPFGAHRGKTPTSAFDRAADRTWKGLGPTGDEALDKLRQIAGVGYRGEAGSPLSLAEASGNAPIAYTEKTQGIGDTVFGDKANRLRGEQSANRQGVIQSVAPNGEPLKVSDLARQMSDQIHNTAEANTTAQQGIVDAMHGTSGPTKTAAADSGNRVLDIAEHNNEAARDQVTEFYLGIDPENRIHLAMSPLHEASDTITKGINPKVHIRSIPAEEVLKMAKELPPSMTFSDLVEFDKTVGQTRWQLSKKGDDHGAELLEKLQERIHEMRDGSLDRHAGWEKGAVARGDLKPDQAVYSRLQRQFDEINNAARGRAGATSAVGAVSAGAEGVPPAGARAVPGPGAAHPSGSPDVSGVALDNEERAAAAQRHDVAKAAHKERKGKYEEGEVGRFIPGNDRTYAGSVPGSAFASGPTGGERTKAWLKAGEGNPEMLNGIKDMAINELHGMTEDGLVTPKDLDKWKTRYGSALSAIDEVEPGFSNRFDAHAAEQQKLLDVTKAGDTAKKTFSKTELAKFLGYEDPAEVDKHIAGLMGDKVGAIKLRRLMADMNGNVEAQEGLRTAVVNYLMERARSDTLVPGPGGEPINASAPGKYLKALNDGRPQLEAVFGPDGYDAAKRVAEEMTRTKAAIDARLTGGSDSAKNLVQFLKESGEGGGHSAAMSTAEGFAIFETIKELSHGVLNQDPMALAKAGMLVAGRFGLHAWQEQLARKRGIAMKEEGDVIREALLDPGYGHSLLERGSSRAQAHAPMDLRDRVQKAQVMGTAADREAHASGGSVGVDHAAHAARMVREVSKLRDQLGKTTKPFLNMHDNKIAAALQIAREAAQ